MRSGRRLTMNLDSDQLWHGKKQPGGNGNSSKNSSRTILPPPVMETVISSSQLLTSSIGIGEFSKNPACKGSAATFSMAVKDHLFPKLKFQKGADASLDFSMDATSICGFLQIKCGVSQADAHQWSDDHHVMLKNIHTDFCNNKIKMIKQQFIAWIKDEEENVCKFMQNSLLLKRDPCNTEVYIKFFCYFGPALTGTAFWNNNKTTKLATDLLTISDEAFIHLCIVNYSATWKAQERKKDRESNVEIPSPRFTKATLKADQLVGRQHVINVLPCGWSQDGLQTFNALAKEISNNRKEHGEEFDKAFKTSTEQQMESRATSKNCKQKRNCIDTYNDLFEGQLIMKNEEDSDNKQDQRVEKNMFMV